jgi:predicted solute-binding protein
MTLLLVDDFETSLLVESLREGWLETDLPFDLRAGLTAADVGPQDAALIPTAEIAHLRETHLVVPEVAIVASGAGSIAMRTPVRPDEVEETDVRLYRASSTAETLARATLEPFYGIRPRAWLAEDAPEAQVVLVEGADAHTPPEAGFAEDLVRAWFILTGQPVVTHLLIVPRDGDPAAIVAAMTSVRDLAQERRRDVRRAVAERYGVDRERLVEIAAARRYRLDVADRRALLMLLQRGNKGSALPYVWRIDYVGGEPAEAES